MARRSGPTDLRLLPGLRCVAPAQDLATTVDSAPLMTRSPLKVRTSGPVRRLTLARSEARNAIDLATLEALERAVADLERDRDVQVVIVASEGPVFCAGGDLDWFATLDAAGAESMMQRMTALLDALWGGPRPVIAEVAGDVFGGGVEFLSACHLRISANTTHMAFRQAAMGVVTGWGGAARLAPLLADGRLLGPLMTGEKLTAMRALQLGLVHEVVEHDALIDRVQETARLLASRSPDAIAGFLDLHRTACDTAFGAVRTREHELFRAGFVSPWFRERLGEWQARRPRGSDAT